MTILIIMAVGILLGYRFLPSKYFKYNSILQLLFTLLLIFSMGVLLGSRENFREEITTIGIDSLFLALLPMTGSALVVYGLTSWYQKHKKGGQ